MAQQNGGRRRLIGLAGSLAAALSVFLFAACGGSGSTATTTPPTSASGSRAGATPTATAVPFTRLSPTSAGAGLTLGKTQVTAPVSGQCDVTAVVSRDASHVAFVRSKTAAGATNCPLNGAVMIVSADGSGLHELAASGMFPFFAPDGTKVGFYSAPDASGCAAQLQLVTLTGTAVATIPGPFAQTEPNSPMSPDGGHLLLDSCSGKAEVLTVAGKPGPAVSVPSTLGLSASPTFVPFGWTPDGKAVLLHGGSAFFLEDPSSGAVTAAPQSTVVLIQTRVPWELQTAKWNPSLPLQYQ